ncbi:MAG: hypothetical protein AABM64_05210 [Pseudomonadota bacterium]
MRTNVLVMLLILLLPHAAHADRITQMNQSDLCIYTAKLQVAGYYYFEQGKPREEVKIVWHGDETQNEIDFVNRMLDDAYLWLTNARNNGAELLPVQTFGDLVFEACMNGKLL